MKKTVVCVLTLIFLMLGSAVVGAAPKNDQQNSSIGIIDVNRIMAESPKIKAMQEQLDQIGKRLADQVDAEKPNLSAEEYKKRQEGAYQEFLRQKKELENQIDLSVKYAVEQVAKEKLINIVLYKNGVVYGGRDITSEVISKMQ